MKRPISMIMAVGISLALNACGSGTTERGENEEDANDPTNFEEPTNSMAYDDELSQEGASASMSLALSALADSHGSSSSSTSLALAGASHENNSTFSRSCDDEDGDAVVTIEADVDRKFTFDGIRRQIERTITGEGDLTRTWSKEDSDLNCNDSGKRVDIDWTTDLTGVSLDVAFDRSRDVSVAYEFARRNISYTAERSYTAEGTRTVTWTSHEEDDDAGTITRAKTITSDVSRTHKRENSRGLEREMALDMATDNDEPLKVQVVRSNDDGSLNSKLIESGKLVATRKDDARLETTFANVLIEFDDASCEVKSGEVTYEFYAAASSDEEADESEDEAELTDDESADEEPVKTMKLTIEDGSYTLVDQDSGETVYEFEFENCQYEDFFRN